MAVQYLVTNVRNVLERLNAEAFRWYRNPQVAQQNDWRLEFIRNRQKYWPDVHLQFFGAKEAVSRTLPSDSNLMGKFQRIMFLNPMSSEPRMLPALHCKWDFTGAVNTLRLKLGLFIKTGDERIMLCGMRFETPEGPGDHDYYHAQPIISFHKGQSVGDFTAQWWPTKFPAVLLKAKDPLELIATMCVSLYGGRYLPQVAASKLIGLKAQTSIKTLLTVQ